MPAPSTATRFPSEFLAAYQSARELGSLFIPSESPGALQRQFWGFARALRADGDSTLADSIKVCVRSGPPGVELRARRLDPAAQEISAALKSLPSKPPADSFFDLFEGGESDAT